jgi:hypothetical protein
MLVLVSSGYLRLVQVMAGCQIRLGQFLSRY